VEQLEENVKLAASFAPMTEKESHELTGRSRPMPGAHVLQTLILHSQPDRAPILLPKTVDDILLVLLYRSVSTPWFD